MSVLEILNHAYILETCLQQIILETKAIFQNIVGAFLGPQADARQRLLICLKI